MIEIAGGILLAYFVFWLGTILLVGAIELLNG